MKLDYIITGTGRSATVFYARLLTSIGIPCGHEVFFDHRGVEEAIERLSGNRLLELSLTSRMVVENDISALIPSYLEDLNNLKADSSYMAAPFLDHPCLEPTTVIHVVRNPVSVINSFINSLDYFQSFVPASKTGRKYELFIWRHVPEMTQHVSPCERAALYWMYWNNMIETKSKNKKYILVRAEEGPLPILKWLNISPTKDVFDDRKINTYKRTKEIFSLNNMPEGPIKDRLVSEGRKYGYAMYSDQVFL